MKPAHPLAEPWRPTIAESCGKRRFESTEAARRAHRHASFRVRTYRCDVCGGLHVTHQAPANDELTDADAD